MTRNGPAAVPGQWLRLLAAAAGLIVAAGIGYYSGHATPNDSARAGDLYSAAQSRYASFLFAQRDDGGSNEESLRAYIAYLDARARDRDRQTTNSYAFDKALAYTRLSEIARQRGATDAAARLAHDAGALCPAIGLHNCSANELLRTTRERDRRIWGGPGG
jgi:hypothetical protein